MRNRLLGRTCLGRTCLKWSADGELTALDLCLVLERLAQVDQEVTGLRSGSFDCQPCHLDQLKSFLGRMRDDSAMREAVQAAASADDVASSQQSSATRFPVMLRLPGQKVGRVTVTKQDIPGEPTELNPLRPS